MLDIFFSDDARQDRPSRPGMGPLVATGFVRVAGEALNRLEDDLDQLCARAGFPAGAAGEFKWSPGRSLWMRENLVGNDRLAFYEEALAIAAGAGVGVTVIVGDTTRGTATRVREHTVDVTRLLLERVQRRLESRDRTGIVVVDRPSGGRADEDQFLAECLDAIASGTRYVRPDRIAINVLSTPSSLVRCLQLADVITSATLAYVAGEATYSPRVFVRVRPLLDRDPFGRTGGVGLKLQPDFVYENLYHWLLADTHMSRGIMGWPLPRRDSPYFTSPDAV